MLGHLHIALKSVTQNLKQFDLLVNVFKCRDILVCNVECQFPMTQMILS